MSKRALTLGTMVAAGAVGAAIALGAAAGLGAFAGTTTTVREIAGPEPAAFAKPTRLLTIHDLYDRDAPGVVQVTATKGGQALGSGFVIDKAGHIVTSYHVVRGATHVEVSFSNQERLPARIVGRDPSTGVAVLQVHAASRAFAPLALGDSDLVRVGDSVVAIANPLGEGRSITSGMVGAPVDHTIQTDAALGNGDSGGPLLDARGQVVGLTSSNAGFAIPIDTVRMVVAQLIAQGYVEHPFIGVQARAITSEIARLFRLPVGRGLLVSTVCSATGAAQAGLHAARQQVTVAGNTWPLGGDIIVKADGVPVGSVDLLRQIVAQKRPGEQMALTIVRGGKTMTLNVKLGRQPLSNRC
ncbi:MAG: S1C family serine protease [Gaiellaceae bacterium]